MVHIRLDWMVALVLAAQRGRAARARVWRNKDQLFADA